MYHISIRRGGRQLRNVDKFKATLNVQSNPLHCHGRERDCKPILTREMCQLLDNVQNKPSWIKALHESGCSSDEDGLISILHITYHSLRSNGGVSKSMQCQNLNFCWYWLKTFYHEIWQASASGFSSSNVRIQYFVSWIFLGFGQVKQIEDDIN